MDRELLLEIGVEELPASWLPALTAELSAHLRTRLTEEGLGPKGGVETHSTPRRLAACVPELVDRQEDRDDLVTGPPVAARLDAEGHPSHAALGFARKLGADFDALIEVDTPKGRYLGYRRHIRGRATVDVLPGVLAKVLRDLTFPKAMHWDAELEDGKGDLPFGRPIRWLLFLYGGRVVPFTISRQAASSSPRVQDVAAGAVTYGHRFLASSGRAGRAVKVRTFDDYRKRLAENFVILSRIERRDRIVRELDAQARKVGGRAVWRELPQAVALLDQVPDLVEFPGVVAGTLPAEFLSLPPEVLTTTLIHHQHFFPVVGATGALLPAFLAVTNTQPGSDRGIAVNAERVVAARLRDAKFFWDGDRAVGLEGRLSRLETLTFHKALGSYAAKAQRIERLARDLATDVLGAPGSADEAARAGRLAKADLATDMVREFTELQGAMGGIYAREAGEPEAVWKAVYHHYQPVAVEATAGPAVDALGAARTTWAALSLADKLDTIVGLFLAGERPTGSRDPFGLRRQAHGVLRLLLDAESFVGRRITTTLGSLVARVVAAYGAAGLDLRTGGEELQQFFKERLEFALESRGFDRRNIRAVLRARREAAEPSVIETVENLSALKDVSGSESFRQLATAFKRVRNIARELVHDGAFDAWDAAQPPLGPILVEPAERALLQEIDARRPLVESAIGQGRYREAYAAAAGFEPFVAAFFKDVFVMADDAALKTARLRVMKRLEHLVLQLGDISEIVATES